jgi:hypothetical protein
MLPETRAGPDAHNIALSTTSLTRKLKTKLVSNPIREFNIDVCLRVCAWSMADEEPSCRVNAKLIDVRRREGRVWCADLLMLDVGVWWLACEVCVVQVGALCPERTGLTDSGENVSGFASW